MVFENQYLISDWADATFGPASSNARVAARANEEMAELLRALTADDQHEKAAEEVADIVIVLLRLMTRLGRDLTEEIDRKMAINRKRQWNLTKDGHGYHVRDKVSPCPQESTSE
jgi:NTP pyrophosphatase (non-canonical NTP hydrolase)